MEMLHEMKRFQFYHAVTHHSLVSFVEDRASQFCKINSSLYSNVDNTCLYRYLECLLYKVKLANLLINFYIIHQLIYTLGIDCQWLIVIYSFQCLLWTDLVRCHDRVAEYIIIALVDLVPFSYRLH